jgi:tetratricopeptide (TPR) repeat protein
MRQPTQRTRRSVLLAGFAVLTSAACAGSARLVSTPTPQLEARVARDSLDATAHYHLALALWSDGHYEDADVELKEAVSLDPKYARAYLAMGYLVFARRPALWREIPHHEVPQAWRQAVQRAEVARRRALMLDPLVSMAIVGTVEPDLVKTHTDPLVDNAIRSGFEDYNAGRYEASYAGLSNLVKMVSHRMAGHHRIAWDSLPAMLFWYEGLAAAQTQRYDAAIQNINRVRRRRTATAKDDGMLIVAPLQTGELRYVVGVIQQRGGQDDGAEESFKAALAEDPGLSMAHVRLADLYESQGRMRDAVRERKRAVTTNPDDPSLLVDLGRTFLAAGDAAAAVTALRKAIGARPGMIESYHQLGRALVALHSPDARAALDLFIQYAPSTMASEVADARRLLTRLANGY